MLKRFVLAILCISCALAAERAPAVGEWDTRTAVLVTRDAAESSRWKLELIRNARESIEISCNYAGGKDYREALRLCGEAMERNPKLKVHLLYHTILMDTEDKTLTAELCSRFPDQFFPVKLALGTEIIDHIATVETHLKIVCVDEKYFVTGGTSLEEALSAEGLTTPPKRPRESVPERFAYAGARDMDVVGVGPLAKTLRKIYFTSHARFERLVLDGKLHVDDEALEPYSRYYPVNTDNACTIASLDQSPELIHDAPVKLLLCGPFDKVNSITEEYRRLVESAQHTIDVGHLYFMPVGALWTAFLDASNRGLALSIITNGVHDRSPFPTQIFAWGGRLNYYPILTGVELDGPDYFFANEIPANNVQLYEYYVDQIIYHKKVMVIDGKTLIIGCYNLGRKSHEGDYEITLTIDHPRAAQKVLSVLETDKLYTRGPTRAEATEYYFAPWWVSLGLLQQTLGGLY
jgi:phosphatidylserine/phosphatidylglycerophosphate/cardiolipin synthase-like enzyme